MFGFIGKLAGKGLVTDWSRCLVDLEAGLGEEALKVTSHQLIDEFCAALTLCDEQVTSLEETAASFQAKRRGGTEFNYCYNSVLWGMFYSWNRADKSEFSGFLESVFAFLFKYSDTSKSSALQARVKKSQAYRT
jgi:hypothetical protein